MFWWPKLSKSTNNPQEEEEEGNNSDESNNNLFDTYYELEKRIKDSTHYYQMNDYGNILTLTEPSTQNTKTTNIAISTTTTRTTIATAKNPTNPFEDSSSDFDNEEEDHSSPLSLAMIHESEREEFFDCISQNSPLKNDTLHQVILDKGIKPNNYDPLQEETTRHQSTSSSSSSPLTTFRNFSLLHPSTTSPSASSVTQNTESWYTSNNKEFFSPLENALLHANGEFQEPTPTKTTSFDSDEDQLDMAQEEDEDNDGEGYFTDFHGNKDLEEEKFYESIDKMCNNDIYHTHNVIVEGTPLLKHSNSYHSKNYYSGASSLESPSTTSNTTFTTKRTSLARRANQRKSKQSSASINNSQNLQRHQPLSNQPIVMKELKTDNHNDFHMDFKMILLEDLGTAASWVILLMPYIAFVVSILLESNTVRLASIGPLSAAAACPQNHTTTLPILQNNHSALTYPCHFSYSIHERYKRKELRLDGLAFESGNIPSVPVLSTFLHGDAVFDILSTTAVAYINRGVLEASVVVLQRPATHDNDEGKGDDDEKWTLMYSSAPVLLSMTCQAYGDAEVDRSTNWYCKSPRLIDVLFSSPETALYAGGDIRINVLYSYRPQRNTNMDGSGGGKGETDNRYVISESIRNNHDNDDYSYNSSGRDHDGDYDAFYFRDDDDDDDDFRNDYLSSSFVYTTEHGAYNLFQEVLDSTHIDKFEFLKEITIISSYTLESMSLFAMQLDTAVRLITFTVSILFLIYWCWCIGMHAFFCFCLSDQSKIMKKQRQMATMWWESPWILFPERRYILVLLVSLLLMQEPILAAMYFFPSLGSSTRLHVAADAMIGIGVNGIMFVYLCLFHGFRYHTAKVNYKRVEHQRKVLQLRRAAQYVTNTDSEDAISQYTQDYYEKFGDIDGSASSEHLRLQHDPCSDGWADFLLLKLLLFVIGNVAVFGMAYCRFPPRNEALSPRLLDGYTKIYVASSLIEFATLIIWVYLIVAAALSTGKSLRSEPFLSTRPAQLSYRILFAHMTLGFTALAVSVVMDSIRLLQHWTLDRDDEHIYSALRDDDTVDNSHVTRTTLNEIVLRVLSHVARQFPYSGTAATVGPGRILFATVSILITAFIFLPAHTFEEEEVDDPELSLGFTGGVRKFINRGQQLRDKRFVVNLARTSKTWRVFPIPILANPQDSFVHQDHAFQIYRDLRIDSSNLHDRGVVSIGPYVPVFCLELACWLNEASWQSYYSPAGFSSNDAEFGGMNLEGIGLRLEGAVLDEVTNTQAFVATNTSAQVDGEADSIIVVSFRGTANAANLKTDLRSRQVPLLDQLAGVGSAPFSIYPDHVDIYDSDGWIWDTPTYGTTDRVRCMSCHPRKAESLSSSSEAHYYFQKQKKQKIPSFRAGAKALLQATPFARSSFPLVHEGFQEVYTHIRRKLLDILLPVLQRQFERSVSTIDEEGNRGGGGGDNEPLALPKIYITGHSLGGSLGQLLALDLANNCELVLPSVIPEVAKEEEFYNPVEELFQLPSNDLDDPIISSVCSTTDFSTTVPQREELRLRPPIAVYTFGQPRVGNRPFSRLYKQKVPHTFRVVNEGDIITTLPNFVFCNGIYKHAGLEVVLDEGRTGNILVGPTVVETLFRFHKVRTNVVAHTMNRYRDCLECAFDQHELQEYYKGHSEGINGNANLSIINDKSTTSSCGKGVGIGSSGGVSGGGGSVMVGRNSRASTVIPEWMTSVK